MKKNILLIINPAAGSIDVPQVISEMKSAAEAHDFDLYIYKTDGENDKVNIEGKLSTTKFDRVIIAGGDGTVNFVASVIEKTNISIGVLMCGSANGLATALQFPPGLSEQINVALGDRLILMDCIDINQKTCLHIADLGINAELVHNFDDTKIRGIFGYMLHSIPTLFTSDHPYKFEIYIEDKTIKKKGILLAIANASKYGTGAVINPKGTVNDGKFEIVIFKKLNFLRILKTFFSSSKFHPRFAETYCVHEAKIRCKDPVGLQIDGEYLGEVQEVEARINRGAIKVAVPQS
jgi:diacylglycerol kinase (ATP)